MTVLVINLGTSDLSVKLESEASKNFIVIEFPSITNLPAKLAQLTEDEKKIWYNQKNLILTHLCPEIGLEVVNNQYEFRALTKKLLQAYQANQEFWYSRITFSRIRGVVETAINKYKVKTIYLVVSDQIDEFYQDTVHAFEIVCLWLKKAFADKSLEIKSWVIDPTIKLNEDADKLFDSYYDLFKTIGKPSQMLISIKAGTPQMQTALRIQAIGSDTQKLLFIDPELDPRKILQGQPSECQITCYWRLIQKQKYATVKLLLEKRWDFAGAREILKEWQETLKFFIENIQDNDIQSDEEKLKNIIADIDLAVNCFNLATKVNRDGDNLNIWLNLYTQCRIFWQLEEIANLLTRLGSFYELILKELLKIFEGEQYLINNIIDKGIIDRTKMPEALWKALEKAADKKIIDPTYKLDNRYSLLNFVEALIYFKNNKTQVSAWKTLVAALKKINYWCDKRNQLIHKAQGISLQTMENQRKTDISKWTVNDENDKFKANPRDACPPEQILENLTQVCSNVLKIHKQQKSSYSLYIGTKETTPYYIYSDLVEKIIAQL